VQQGSPTTAEGSTQIQVSVEVGREGGEVRRVKEDSGHEAFAGVVVGLALPPHQHDQHGKQVRYARHANYLSAHELARHLLFGPDSLHELKVIDGHAAAGQLDLVLGSG